MYGVYGRNYANEIILFFVEQTFEDAFDIWADNSFMTKIVDMETGEVVWC